MAGFRRTIGCMAISVALATTAIGGAPVSAQTLDERSLAGDPTVPHERMAASQRIFAAQTSSGAYLAGAFAIQQNDIRNATRFMAQALARSPGNPNLIRTSFHLLVRDGQIDAALDLVDDLLAEQPADQLAHTVLMLRDAREGRYDAALERMEDISRRDVAGIVMPIIEGWLLAGAGDVEGAVLVLREAAEIDGLTVIARLHEGLILDMSGDADGALAAFEVALEDALTLRLVQAAGSLFERVGDVERAQGLYQDFLAQAPASTFIEYELRRLGEGRSAERLIDTPAEGIAEALFQVSSALNQERANNHALVNTQLALYARPGFPLAKILLGDVLVDLEQYRYAIDVFRAVAGSPPANWTARLSIGQVLQELDRGGEAETLLEEMAAERPDRAEPLIQLGDVHRVERRFGEAVAAYDEASQRAPGLVEEDWTFYYRRGIALERARQWDRAEADLELAIALNPDHAHLLNYLGYSWIDRGENVAEAEDLIRRAVELLPNDGYIIDSLGWVYYRTGRLDEAVATLEQAVSLLPEDPVINDHLGDAYWMVGRYPEARFQWERALRSLEDDPDPEPGMSDRIREKLEVGVTDPGFVEMPEPVANNGNPI